MSVPRLSPGMSDASGTARAYYRSLDAHDYDRLRDLLAPDVVQCRPDRTFEGRSALVSFMRDDRPRTDTTHEIRGVYVDAEGDGDEVAVRGRLLDSDDDPLFAFVDVLSVAEGAIGRIETFTR